MAFNISRETPGSRGAPAFGTPLGKEQQAGAAACGSPWRLQQHLGLPMAVSLSLALVTAAWVQCPTMNLPTLLLTAKLGSSWEVWEASILLLPSTVRELPQHHPTELLVPFKGDSALWLSPGSTVEVGELRQNVTATQIGSKRKGKQYGLGDHEVADPPNIRNHQNHWGFNWEKRLIDIKGRELIMKCLSMHLIQSVGTRPELWGFLSTNNRSSETVFAPLPKDQHPAACFILLALGLGTRFAAKAKSRRITGSQDQVFSLFSSAPEGIINSVFYLKADSVHLR